MSINRPPFYKMFTEPLGVLAIRKVVPYHHELKALPKANGQPVIVVPGLTTNNASTTIIRTFLKSKGFKVYGWDQGFNINYTQKVENKLIRQIKRVSEKHGQKVALIGWSLGGITVRIAAWKAMDYISQIISLGAPFKGLRKGATNVDWWFQLITGQKVEDFNPTWLKQAEEQPLVPSTSIYSRKDGMVAWDTCIDSEEGPITQNIEVSSNHLGFGFDPEVWMIVYDRLIQDPYDWKPYQA